MPITRQLTPEELAALEVQGIDPRQYAGKELTLLTDDDIAAQKQQPVAQTDTGQYSALGAVGKTLQSRAGSLIGGGLAGLGGYAAATPFAPATGGASYLVPIGASILSALAGAYAGGKGQQAIQGEEVTKQLESELAQAQEQHPVIVPATEIAAGAMLGGGKFSPTTAISGVKGIGRALAGKTLLEGEKEAALNVGMQSLLNPAIATGTSLAMEGQMPSATDLALQTVGGALFAKPNVLGRLAGRPQEVKRAKAQEAEDDALVKSLADEIPAGPESEFTAKNEDGSYVINNNSVKSIFMANNQKPVVRRIPKTATPQEKYKIQIENAKAKAFNSKLATTPLADMRSQLHTDFLDMQTKAAAEAQAAEAAKVEIPKPEPAPEPNKTVIPEVVKPAATTAEVLGKTEPTKVEQPDQKLEDFKKAREQVVTEQLKATGIEPAPEPTAKPITANQARIVNPETLLQSDVGRRQTELSPEVAAETGVNAKAYAPPKKVTEKDFIEIGKLQRDKPELAMHRATMFHHGVLSPVLEHVGDLMHRMNDVNTFKYGGYEYVKSKVERAIRALTSKYGFLREHLENIEHNADYKKINKEVYNKQLDDLLANYAKEHEKLPAYNEAHRLAKKATVSLGKKEWGDALDALAELNKHLDTEQEWTRFSREGLTSESTASAPSKSGRTQPTKMDEYRNNLKRIGILEQLVKNREGSPEELAAHSNAINVLRTKNIAFMQQRNAAITKQRAEAKTVAQWLMEAKQSLKGSAYHQLANDLRLDPASGKVKIIVGDELTVDTGQRSHYYFTNKGAEEIRMALSDASDPHGVLHEIIHAGTLAKLPFEWTYLKGTALKKAYDDYLATGKDNDIKELVKAYYSAIDQLGLDKDLFSKKSIMGFPNKMQDRYGHESSYALGNIGEFISMAFTNQEFQNLLNALKSTNGQSVWQRMLVAIRRILGINPKNDSLLAEVMRPIDSLLQKNRPGEVSFGEVGAKAFAPPKSSSVPPEMQRRGFSFVPFLMSRVDKIAARHNNPTGHYVAEAFHKFFGEFDYKTGQIGNRIISYLEGFSPEQIEKTYHYLYDIDNAGKSAIKLSPEEKKLASDITESLRDIRKEQIASGPRIRLESGALRRAKIKGAGTDEGYMFNVLDQNVASEWAENPGGALAKSYDKAYIDHLVSHGKTVEEAATTLRDYKSALGNRGVKKVEYGAIRKGEGYGLPWQLVDKNLASASLRYGARAARDLSYFKHIQSDPKMRKALDIADEERHRVPATEHTDIQYIGSSKEVQDALRSVIGIDMPVNKQLMAAARAAGNTVMGIGTAARNIMTMPGIAATYVQAKQLPLMWQALKEMNTRKARAFLANATKASYQDFDAAGYMKDDPNPAINLLNKYSSFMRKYQGRDFSDKFEAEYYYSLGELLATDNIARAHAGDVEARAFLRKFGDIVDGGYQKLFKGKFNQDDISRIAKRFVDATRGTYSAEGLPSFALEGELAPFTALSKFAIEKSNTVWKDVVEPLKEGNYGPILRYALGSLGVGALIEQMNELLSNKRGPDPTISEVWQHGSADDVIAKVIGLGQLASFAGVISDGAKAAMQMIQGKELRYNQPLSFPLYTLMTETLLGNAKDAAAAIQEGQDPLEVLSMLAVNIAGQSVQTMRYVDANVLRPGEAKRKEKFRDLSTFRRMEGQAAGPNIKSNPYLEADAKKFKRSKDLRESAGMVQSLVNKAIEEAGNDPELLARKLSNLKRNSYQTMPSYDRMPRSFQKYYEFIEKTQGKEAADALVEDYLQQNTLNRAKSQMIP